MSTRKTHKTMMGMGEERRRSPRISIGRLDKDHHHRHQQEQLIIRRRSRTKRKIDDSCPTPLSKLAKQVWKGRDSPKDADDHSTDDPCEAAALEWRSAGQMIIRENQKHDHGKAAAASIMPDKHTLELVLDTLQRRDTYEIFAEPVDPDEVEDYYEIIKEPMDFGTMRAKLHEGMYENLQQFEHDVFLIPENAMHFNSSATIYFRQARVVHELATKVFHALKTDPENFVSEFSGTRRRSMRKALRDPLKGSVCGHHHSKGTTNSQYSCRRASKKNPHATKFAAGSGRDGRLSEGVADRRQSYWASLYNLGHGDKSLLLMMNEGDDIRGWYKDSLMSYVKDLGPTAQMVAKRKLLLLGQQHDHGSNTASSSSAATHTTTLVGNPLKRFRTFRDFAPAAGGGSPSFLPKAKAGDVVIGLIQEQEAAAAANSRRRVEKKKKTDDDDHDRRGGGKEEKISRNNRPNNIIIAAKKEATRNADDNNNNVMRPVILALENSHPNNNANATADQLYKLRNKKAAADHRSRQEEPTSISHQFIFDLPFLQARLHQMNKKKKNVAPSFQKIAGGGGVNSTPESVPVTKPFLYNHQSNNPSLISNLALQL